MAKGFWEKYRDPRWQKRRLEIMGKAQWECERCGDKGETLNVHHKLYRKGADPWDYPDHELQCLCESCHETAHDIQARIKAQLARLSESHQLYVLGYALGIELISYGAPTDPKPEIRNARQLFDHFGWEIQSGVGDAYGLTDPEMDGAMLEDGTLDGEILWATLRKKREEGK